MSHIIYIARHFSVLIFTAIYQNICKNILQQSPIAHPSVWWILYTTFKTLYSKKSKCPLICHLKVKKNYYHLYNNICIERGPLMLPKTQPTVPKWLKFLLIQWWSFWDNDRNKHKHRTAVIQCLFGECPYHKQIVPTDTAIKVTSDYTCLPGDIHGISLINICGSCKPNHILSQSI